MKIGIDGTPLTIPYHCGQRHYLESLIFNLAKIDKKNQYLIFTSKKVRIPKQKNFSLVLFSFKPPLFKRQIILPLSVKGQHVDIFHYPDVIGSVFFKSPKIVTTVHDLAPVSAYPSWSQSPKYALMKKYNYFVRKYTIKNSSAFIVNSNSIAKELKRFINVEKPITVIYEGVDKNFRRMKDDKKKYFLAMTDFSPRKNISSVLEAHSLFLKQSGSETKLQIVVSTSYPIPAILAKAQELETKKQIKILQDVSFKTLVKLYNRALCLIYPSLYEGFGLPILEAMACGCPVITSNYGAMKEVAGSAAYLVNPNSPGEIAKAMEKIVKNKKLAAGLKLKGLKRAKSFSWEETARKSLKVYKEINKKSNLGFRKELI